MADEPASKRPKGINADEIAEFRRLYSERRTRVEAKTDAAFAFKEPR